MRRKFYHKKVFFFDEKEGLLGRKTPYEKAVLAWKKLYYEKECRRWTKGFYNEKEVPSGQRVLLRAGSSIIAKDILNMKRKLHYVKIALL